MLHQGINTYWLFSPLWALLWIVYVNAECTFELLWLVVVHHLEQQAEQGRTQDMQLVRMKAVLALKSDQGFDFGAEKFLRIQCQHNCAKIKVISG